MVSMVASQQEGPGLALKSNRRRLSKKRVKISHRYFICGSFFSQQEKDNHPLPLKNILQDGTENPLFRL